MSIIQDDYVQIVINTKDLNKKYEEFLTKEKIVEISQKVYAEIKKDISSDLLEKAIGITVFHSFSLSLVDLGTKSLKNLLLVLGGEFEEKSDSFVKNYIEFKKSNYESIKIWHRNKLSTLLDASFKANVSSNIAQNYFDQKYESFIFPYIQIAVDKNIPSQNQSHEEILEKLYEILTEGSYV